MNEIQRQHYLKALGIESYCARWILPASPIPRACAMPISLPPQPSALGSIVDETSTKETHCKESAIQALTDLKAGKVETPTKANPLNTQIATDKPRFSLGLWRVSDDLLVIDSREAKLALPTDQLLANMISALGYSLPGLPKAEILCWPMVENAIAGQSESDAKGMLQAYLEAQISRRPAKFLLLMGREAARYALPDPMPFEEVVGQSIPMKTLSVSASITYSLTALLRNPALKSNTWKSIQKLRIDL